MTTRDVLVGARDLVERGWTQGANAVNTRGVRVWTDSPMAARFCIAGAITRAALDQGPVIESKEAVRVVIGEQLHIWNDAPGRTQAEVLAALDAAIQREEQG